MQSIEHSSLSTSQISDAPLCPVRWAISVKGHRQLSVFRLDGDALYYVVCFKKHLRLLPFTVMKLLNIYILPNFMQWRRSGIVGVL